MHKGVVWMAAVVGSLGLVASAAEKAPLRVVMVSGAFEYESHKSLPILKKHLESQYPVRCTILQATKRQGDDVPGLEALDGCDVMVLFMRRQRLKGEQLAAFKRYCLAGKPIVGIRTASHAVQTWLELDKLVLGGNYHGHFGGGPVCQVSLRPEALGHPILQGVLPYASKASLYRNTGLSKDCDVLIHGEITVKGKDGKPQVHREPIAWTRRFQGGRIFYTSLGHQDDFRQDSFLRLVTNAILWVSEQEPAAKGGG